MALQSHQTSVKRQAGLGALQSHQPSVKGQASFVALQSHQLSVQAFGAPGFVFLLAAVPFSLPFSAFPWQLGSLQGCPKERKCVEQLALQAALNFQGHFSSHWLCKALSLRQEQDSHSTLKLSCRSTKAQLFPRTGLSSLSHVSLQGCPLQARPSKAGKARTRAEGSRPPLDPSPLTSGLAGPVDTGPTLPRTSAPTPSASGP